MNLSTVNIITLKSGDLQTLTSFADDKAGNVEAESLFTKTLLAIDKTISPDDMECFLDDGFYELNEHEVLIVHSVAVENNNDGFKPSGLDWDDVAVGDKVNVHRKDIHDMFNHDFTGTVIDKNATHIIVEDQDGDCFTVDPDQLSHNTDHIMHNE